MVKNQKLSAALKAGLQPESNPLLDTMYKYGDDSFRRNFESLEIDKQQEIVKSLKEYELKLTEYREYDDVYLFKLLDEAKEKSSKITNSGAMQRFATLEILRERSKEKRTKEIFSSLQAEIITWSTAILAFCALVMLFVEGIRGE